MERLGRATWPEQPRGSGEGDGNRPNTIVKTFRLRYSSAVASTAATTAVKLMHRKRLMIETNWRESAVIDSGYNVADTAESSVLACE
jgi:hypothetical protein